MPVDRDKHHLLKKDLFGEVWQYSSLDGDKIVRDTRTSPVWVRWLARRLLAREARTLCALEGIEGLPQLLHVETDTLERSYLTGQPMQDAKPTSQRYFNAASKLLRRLHRAGVVHNDLAKEPNILVRPDGSPALIDYQLAFVSERRGKLFRVLAYDDIRHLLKHKRSYCASALTGRERRILAQRSLPSRVWMRTVKPLYLFVTRRLLNWSDREGASDRGRQH